MRGYRWSDLEADARDALAYLGTRADIDPDALVVAGHSEGGQLAPSIAHGNPHVAAVVMLAGPILTNVVTPAKPPVVDAEIERRLLAFLGSVRR